MRSASSTLLSCPLCPCGEGAVFHKDRLRVYYKCPICSLIFVDPQNYVSEEAEKEEYCLHENNIEDDGYRAFLSRAAQPVFDFFAESEDKRIGLDFGCGPAPVLASILTSNDTKFSVVNYDKYFFPATQEDIFSHDNQYDFITSTEVVEHLHSPGTVLKSLWRVLKPGGILVIMTKRAEGSVAKFQNWHYIRDKTHVCFFSDATFEWIAQTLFSAQEKKYSIFHGKDVVSFVKL
ncbi:2-polyprenyl-3-methyl-5-hydroxy-6-metoxy-1,4-benzoquinol methylase [Strigomonas culicis]|uniref:2-polyprenyl-3-methyl-5-hydroxy-6-metoxy-1, 4-benzoquinol methylase n=1 Tax=Strigomonas culicis TaxID=28005 RepID=S9VMK3_9TRYP|nr:2-polyprenyl-3-methyl-5-hydroxy-6-metoxy-1,4-benzoquinol methylase [Strigomonas culicis]|eukprot:EPY28376.1 2-polyprenyl-3-methyl-5-hydroxy-6-metoxy-1,4-benzoquinol methylase [Strigomonas culicis]